MFRIGYEEMGKYATETITFEKNPTMVVVLLNSMENPCAILQDGKSVNFGSDNSNSQRITASLSKNTLTLTNGSITYALGYMAFG